MTKRASVELALQGIKGTAIDPYFADEDRAQRNTVALRDVDYVVEAHFMETPKWGPDDFFAKHAEMFVRRLEHGQTHHHPYLGCREFAATVEPAPNPLPESRLPSEWRPRHLGLMLHDLEFGRRIVPRFFAAKIDEQGVIRVPPFDEAMVVEGIELEGRS